MKKRLFALLLSALLLAGCAVNPTPSTPGSTTTAPGSTGTTTETLVDSVPKLTIHYIDVGQADCALLSFNGQYVLIDGGNVADSSLVVSYLQQQGVQELEAVICTHAHEDHVGGLPGVLAVFPTEAVYAPTKTYASNCFDDFLYYTDQQDLEVTIPTPGDSFRLDAVTLTFLGPVKSYANTNDTSLVVMVRYGKTCFLFTGDMETGAENDMLDYWGEDFDWHADVLKVGHHGSETSTSYRFVWEVMPAHGIISVGEGNSYNHPNELPLSRLDAAGVTLYRTDKLGTILATSDGEAVTLSWQNSNRQPDAPSAAPQPPAPTENPTQPTEEPTAPTETKQQYIGNKNSKTLHLPTCKSLPKEENRVYFNDYDQAIDAGYKPCSRCLKGKQNG